MRTASLLFSTLLLSLPSACATVNDVGRVMNVRDLMGERRTYENKDVVVQGYLQFTPGRRGLSISKELSPHEEGGVRLDCVTIWGYRDSEIERLFRLNGKLVRVAGRFRFIPLKPNEMNLWECNDYGLVVASVTDLER